MKTTFWFVQCPVSESEQRHLEARFRERAQFLGTKLSGMAAYLRDLTRELSRMFKQKLLVKDGGALIVPDVARLAELVAAVRR